ncbi:acyl-CoA dehydrogenase [Algoriphagus kandeliae]|uniref:Acyl-CoA dehydrogenase n=1 Tax=Algoriphagus kandeliae TaxID=2562278 RepID=A0A4Y9QTA7_9BACT|nr:acyl-CoA dehydrogenase [Algoriphagus kandeliae]TFV94155.1 acyl-CoA dehydrogenase [Algoriphagus kandeliae]
MEIFNADFASLAEKSGQLIPEWLEEIYAQRWFKLFVPRDLGGLELSLPDALKVEESLARLDGSLGWTVTLCAGAAWFVGFLDQDFSKEIFSNPKVCLAGSGHVGGKAEKQDGFFLISGKWNYASGALHATHFTANCELWENEAPILDASGNPIVKAFILQKNEVEILDAWHYMGMKATGSHAFRTNQLLVSKNRCFEIAPEKAIRSEAIYRFPFLQFAEATLAVNILGISFHLQELIRTTFWKRQGEKKLEKEYVDFFVMLEKKSQKKLDEKRMSFYHEVEKAWEELESQGWISQATLQRVSKTSRKLTQVCRKWNAKMYPFGGLEAAREDTELNRVWRDFNTVSQHSLLIFPF